MNQAQLFQNWLIPFVPLGKECGVARTDAVEAIKQIYDHNFVFLGYDAFSVFPNGTRQPITDFCASFSVRDQPSLDEAINSLKDDSLQVTHYVFNFRSSA